MQVLALAVGLAVGCGSDQSDSPGCVAGESVGCIGPEGCSGYQVCNDDGASYGPCVCADAGAATGGGATVSTGGSSAGGGNGTGGTGGSGAAGGSTAAGGTDLAGGTSATGGSGGDDGTGGAVVDCEPADMSDWVAPAYTPARAPAQVCTEALIRQYSTDCLNGTDCSAFEAGGEHVACGDCLRPTPVEEAEYGPVVLFGTLRETNFAGCIELVGEAACAEHQQAKSRCEHDACHDNCPITDTASLTLYQQCRVEARSGVCDAYREAAVCITDSAHVEACSGDDFEEALVAVGTVFCGS
jgi:hypothetical protein